MLCVSEKVKMQGTSVALGYFDGIHIGHKGVLESAIHQARERSLVPVVLLFDVHPRELISGKAPKRLVTDEKKKKRLEAMGFEVISFDFSKAMNITADEFIDGVLVSELNSKVICCGYDFRFGKGGRGTAADLKKRLSASDVSVFVTDGVCCDGETVSSSRIRQYIENGEIEKANKMLGEYFSYDFTVVKGDGIGHTWGFPTINQCFPEEFIVPGYGVYASETVVDGRVYRSITNVGVRPTVKKDLLRSETCIFDYSGSLYGERIEVRLIKQIRKEIKFSSFDELRQQIAKDVERAKQIHKQKSEVV